MKNLISRLSDLWQSLPSEVKGSIVTISVLVGLIILTALILGLENMWTSFVATISRQAIFRGMLLILVTLGLSVIWVLVYGRFVISSAYNEAVNEVKKALNEDIHKLNTLASIHIPESTNQMREYHEETKKTFSDWQAIADRILSTAAKSTFQNVWLTKPWEYIDFIEKADDKIVNSTSLQKHIERITLYGTMVGFAFILPEALRKQACRAQEQLKSITIIASDEETIVGDSSRQLVCYPLWLIVRLTQLLLECNRFISPIISGCHDFNIKIGYLPHDVFTAAIHLPPNEMVVLQALDSLALIRVLEGIEMQRGFLYTNENAKNDLYDRYVAVLRSLENQFYTNAKRKREGQRKREKWRFVGTGGNLVLEISNPHWTWNNNAIDKILSKEEYDEADDRVLTFPTSNISIKSFLDMFLQRLQMEGTTGNDLRSFESMIQRKKQVWAKHHPLECLCSLTKYE